MIGDAKAAGKRHSTKAHGPEFKEKNSQGQSYKHIAHAGKSHGGGGKEVKSTAARVRDRSPGTGTSDKQAPHKQREFKEVKHVDQGQILNEWCSGKRKSYK